MCPKCGSHNCCRREIQTGWHNDHQDATLGCAGSETRFNVHCDTVIEGPLLLFFWLRNWICYFLLNLWNTLSELMPLSLVVRSLLSGLFFVGMGWRSRFTAVRDLRLQHIHTQPDSIVTVNIGACCLYWKGPSLLLASIASWLALVTPLVLKVPTCQ